MHVSVDDPLATPLVAQTVDIEIARYDGVISAPSTTGFTYTRNFVRTTDDYTINLPYISGSSPNGKDGNGNAVTGFSGETSLIPLSQIWHNAVNVNYVRQRTVRSALVARSVL